MCAFLSAIVLKNGDILTMPDATDSHTDLIAYFNLKERGAYGNADWVRVELIADGEDYADPKHYFLKLDEREAPEWWGEIEDSTQDAMRAKLDRMIIRDHRAILLGGCWIVAEGGKVDKALHCRFAHILDGGTVTTMRGGTVTTMRGGTVTTMRGGTVTTMGGSSYSWMTATIATFSGGEILKPLEPQAEILKVLGEAKIAGKKAKATAKPKAVTA